MVARQNPVSVGCLAASTIPKMFIVALRLTGRAILLPCAHGCECTQLFHERVGSLGREVPSGPGSAIRVDERCWARRPAAVTGSEEFPRTRSSCPLPLLAVCNAGSIDCLIVLMRYVLQTPGERDRLCESRNMLYYEIVKQLLENSNVRQQDLPGGCYLLDVTAAVANLHEDEDVETHIREHIIHHQPPRNPPGNNGQSHTDPRRYSLGKVVPRRLIQGPGGTRFVLLLYNVGKRLEEINTLITQRNIAGLIWRCQP